MQQVRDELINFDGQHSPGLPKVETYRESLFQLIDHSVSEGLGSSLIREIAIVYIITSAADGEERTCHRKLH